MIAQPSLHVRALAHGDRACWQELYEGYLTFYNSPLASQQLDLVWSWLMNADHEVNGLVAEGDNGLVGLAHYREFARPRLASVGGFLDDLFVAPSARGGGAVDALLAALRQIGAERGWSVIRWTTAEDNYRARAKYDREAQRTLWVTYDMTPGSAAAHKG